MKTQPRKFLPRPPTDVYDAVSSSLEQAAQKFDVDPGQVTKAQFFSVAKVTEWDVRKFGGFASLKDQIFPPEEGDDEEDREGPTVKYKRPPIPKLDSFAVHDFDMRPLFKKNEVVKVVVQPDTHCPFHDEKAVNAFCEFLEFYRPHVLINLGDFLENESVSRWPSRNPKPRRLVPEIKAAKEVLAKIQKAAGPQCKNKFFLTGNHEFWLQDYLNARIPEVLDGIEELGMSLEFPKLLGLDALGYKVIPVNEILRVGHAHFIHGYYTGTHHAKKHLDVFGASVYYGHLHSVSSYSGVSVRGIHEAMSLGCLRTLDAAFLKGSPHSWSHAFGIFEYRKNGTYTRIAPIMINGSFSYNGVVYGKR